MKRVLITGANSFLGDNTKKYLEEHGDYQVDILDMLDENWRKTDFSKYDVIFNVCAIVHRPDEKDIDLYYKVNRDLAVEIAKKAKEAGVKQFIQTSTNGVFGIEVGIMSPDKGYNPKTPYEKSKFEADCLLEELRDDKFKVCIVRPPLIYGRGCRGNFPKLEKFALTRHFFPSLKNKKDFIYINNLTSFIEYAIDNSINDLCYPRDIPPASVSFLITNIAKRNKNAVHLLAIFNPFVKVVMRFNRKIRLIFGNNYFVGDGLFGWIPPQSIDSALDEMYLL